MKFTSLLVGFFSLIGLLSLRGQEGRTGALLGAESRDAEAVKAADSIGIGIFKSVGRQETGASGEFYINAVVEIRETLKGDVTGEIRSSYSRLRMASGGKEDLPQVKVDYIFFFSGYGNLYGIQKLLPCTDATVARVKELIAARAAPSPPVGKPPPGQ